MRAVGAQVSDDFLDAVLIDDTNALVRDAQTNEAFLGFEPESLVLQIRQKATTSSVVGVGNVIAAHRALPSHLANLGHDLKSLILLMVAHDGWAESETLYQRQQRITSACSQQSATRERRGAPIADYEVVEQPDIDEFEGRFQAPGDAFVCLAGLISQAVRNYHKLNAPSRRTATASLFECLILEFKVYRLLHAIQPGLGMIFSER